MSARYVLRRLAGSLSTLFGVAVLVFFVLRLLPGDEITASLGTEAGALTPAQREALEEYYGLDRPIVVQFFTWLGNVLTGNLGVSRSSGASVSSLIAEALPVTLELAVLSIVIGILLGVSIGVFAASRPGSPLDAVGQGFGLLGLATPEFVTASALVAVLAAWFSYFPSAGDYVGFFEFPLQNLQQQFFPALVLGISLAATIMRTTRSAYLEAAGQDFVRTAKGKGLSSSRVRWRHVLHNALIPIVTIAGILFGYLLGGTVIVEQIFGLPGLGQLVLTGIFQREYAIVQSTVLIVAAAFVLVNLIVDLLYAMIDPRVRLR
jgi:peptide/nickel transport system permease protein